MAAIILSESLKLVTNDLAAGVIQEVINYDPLFSILPFKPVNGLVYGVYRENGVGSAAAYGVGDTWTETATTFSSATFQLTTLGDFASVNRLTETASQAQGNSSRTNQLVVKSRAVARLFSTYFITGTGSSNQFTGLTSLVTGGQTLVSATNGSNVSLQMIDRLIDAVKVSGKKYVLVAPRTYRAIKTLLYAAGGASSTDMAVLPDGTKIELGLPWNGATIVKNDFIPTNLTVGTSSGVCTSAFCVVLDETQGVCGLSLGGDVGIKVTPSSPADLKDEIRDKITWDCSLALHSTRSLAMLTGLLDQTA